ncbi:MAG: TRAP transporter small permease [Lachnospiraceae bacterium]|jgi:TRAP-type C4-dicarboxylate transport system permease small subunit|nr:TRAP transporter small permease [Lachnospiraceae bacterium]MCI9681150.1 TRAP transporter small permease [Lachnospiraceae bacterium]
MKKMYYKILKVIETAVWGSAAVMLLALAALVSVELICRNFFDFSLKIVEECSFIMLSYISYLSAAYAFHRRAHVAVEFVYGKLPNVARKVLYICTYVGSLIFLVFVTKIGFEFAMSAGKIPLTITRLPKNVIYIWLPVGAVFMIFFIICDLIETLVFKDPASLMTAEEKQAQEIEEMLALEKEVG